MRTVLTVTLLCLLRGAAFSQGTPARELLLFEEANVTAATKRPQTARSAPAVVTVITAEDIRRFGYRTLAEALRLPAGLYTSSDRNYSYLGVRGFQRPTDYNDRVLLLVNGHTYNDDIYQQAAIGNEFGIDMEAIERIEVSRGPGSALYGGNALFAVVNVVTRTGHEHPGVRVLAETGSFGRKRGQMSIGHVFENGADLYASASILDLDGQSSLYYPEYDTPQTNHGVARHVDGEQAVNLFVSGHYEGWKIQGGANRREKQIPTGAYDSIFNDPQTRTVDERAFGEVQYEKEFSPSASLTGRAYLDNYEYDGTYPTDVDGQRILNRDLASSRWVGGELRGRWRPSEIHLVTVGSEYSYHPRATQENFDVGSAERFLDERSFGLVGFFLQDEIHLPFHLTAIVGARYDHAYPGIDDANPRAALVWEPSADTVIKALYGQAFRPPNLYELYYYPPTNGVAGQPSPKLRPERITTYELAAEHWLTQQTRTVLTIFHHEIGSLVDQVEPQPDVIAYSNVGGTRANGGSLMLDMELAANLRFRASYSFQDVRANGGQLLSNSPKHAGRFGAQFPIFLGGDGGTEILVVGPRRTLARNELDTVVLGNASLNFPTPIEDLHLSLGLYNVFNQKYSDPAGTEHRQDSLPQDRFTFRTQVRYAF